MRQKAVKLFQIGEEQNLVYADDLLLEDESGSDLKMMIKLIKLIKLKVNLRKSKMMVFDESRTVRDVIKRTRLEHVWLFKCLGCVVNEN